MKDSFLSYEVLPETAKVFQLKEYLQQQVASIYVDAEYFPEKLNNVKKAVNYAKKVEEVLATSYFQTQLDMRITIETLKEHLKAETRYHKMRMAFLEEAIFKIRTKKLEYAKKWLRDKGEIGIDNVVKKYYKD